MAFLILTHASVLCVHAVADWKYTVTGVTVRMWHAEFVGVMVPLQITETIRFPADCNVQNVFGISLVPIAVQVLMTPTTSQLLLRHERF